MKCWGCVWGWRLGFEHCNRILATTINQDSNEIVFGKLCVVRSLTTQIRMLTIKERETSVRGFVWWLWDRKLFDVSSQFTQFVMMRTVDTATTHIVSDLCRKQYEHNSSTQEPGGWHKLFLSSKISHSKTSHFHDSYDYDGIPRGMSIHEMTGELQ